MEAAREFLEGLDFQTVVLNPYFIGISALILLLCLYRNWRLFGVLYIGAIAVWGVVEYATEQGGALGGVVPLVGGVMLVAGLAIYFLLVRD
jgi:hypothetical protein